MAQKIEESESNSKGEKKKRIIITDEMAIEFEHFEGFYYVVVFGGLKSLHTKSKLLKNRSLTKKFSKESEAKDYRELLEEKYRKFCEVKN